MPQRFPLTGFRKFAFREPTAVDDPRFNPLINTALDAELNRAITPVAQFSCLPVEETTGFVFTHFGGRYMNGSGQVVILPAGFLTLPALSTVRLELDVGGGVIVQNLGASFTAARVPLYKVTTGPTKILSIEDSRTAYGPSSTGAAESAAAAALVANQAAQNAMTSSADYVYTNAAAREAASGIPNGKRSHTLDSGDYHERVGTLWVYRANTRSNAVATFADLATYPTTRAEMVVTAAGTQAGTFNWITTTLSTDRPAEDGGTIKWHSTNTLGYWQRIITGSEVKMDWWGTPSSVTPALVGVAANKAVALNVILRMGEGSYLFPTALELPSRLILRGAHRYKTTLVQGTLATSIFTFNNGDTLTLGDFNAAPQNLAYDGVVLVPTRSKNILFERISVVNLCLWSSSAGITYATAVTSGGGKNLTGPITTNDCSGTGRGASVSGVSGIQGYYVDGMFVNNSQFDNYDHGIFYWGGDSNHVANGAIANERKAKNIQVRTSTIKNVREGGIWGSMGDGVKLYDNLCDTGGDVGIDVEGSFNVEVVGSTVRGFANGNFTTFFLGQNNLFDRNTSITTVDGQAAFSIRNSSNSTDNDQVTVRSFTARAEVGIGVITGDTVRKLILDGVDATNVRLNHAPVNGEIIEFRGRNTFRLTRALAANQAAVRVGNVSSLITLEGVRVESSVAQPITARGIEVTSGDFNNTATAYIRDNAVKGFTIDIVADNASTNAGISNRFFLSGNRSETNANIVINEVQSGAVKGTYIYERTNQGALGARYPTYEARLSRTGTISTPTAAATFPFNAVVRDSLSMASTADGGLIARRSGLYTISLMVTIEAFLAGERVVAYLAINGGGAALVADLAVPANGNQTIAGNTQLSLNVGDKVQLYLNTTVARNVNLAAANTYFGMSLN